MSEVVSYRLSKDNLREAKALVILQKWREKGYYTRQITTEAPIKLDEWEQSQGIIQIEDLKNTLNQVELLLK